MAAGTRKNKMPLLLLLVVLLAVPVCASGSIRASRAAVPPVLDGQLNDACWQSAQSVDAFVVNNTGAPATNRSVGYFCFDESCLYVGMKCLMPAGMKPAGQARPGDDAPVWGGDEVVEIMVQPGKSERYYQFIVNPYNARYDTTRTENGARSDEKWNGEWKSAAYIGDGYWSAELAIPYYILGVNAKTGSTWAVNLCRDANINGRFELSAIAKNGDFNVATSFVPLTGVNTDFSKHSIEIGAPLTLLLLGKKAQIAVSLPVVNQTGKTQFLCVGLIGMGDSSTDGPWMFLTLAPGKHSAIPLTTTPATDVFNRGNRIYYRSDQSPRGRVVIKDAQSGAVLASASTPTSVTHLAMALDVEPEWRAAMRGTATKEVRAQITSDVASDRPDSALRVELVSSESGKAVVEKSFAASGKVTKISIPCSGLDWGAYQVRATISCGEQQLTVHTPAPILPGGKERIEPLNNFVSELANAKKRGLLDSREIHFMNPRDGWCYFSVEGGATVKLDDIEEPILPVTAWGNPNEAMRNLKAGRHKLTIVRKSGGTLRQLIVRSVPALLFDFYGTAPNIEGFGPYDWDFLAKTVYPHVNTIICAAGPPKPEHGKMWKSIGREWIWQTSRPDVSGVNVDASDPGAVDKVYKLWSQSPGYQDPLSSGTISDEYAGGDDPIFDVYSEAVEKLNASFPGKTFTPYCGGSTYLWGLDKSSKLAEAAISGGGWVAPEYYLEELPNRKAAEDFLSMYMGAIRNWTSRCRE